MPNESQVIDKIKKLLELAASPNEHEAKRAYEAAQRLMAKYAIAYVAEEQKAEEIIRKDYEIKIKKSTGLIDALINIADAVGKPFGTFVLVRSTMGVVHTVMIVGFKTNVILVEYALDCILAQCAIDFRVEYARTRSVSFAPSFWKGVAIALQARFEIKNEENGEAGLVVYDPVKEYMKQFQPGSYASSSFTDSMNGAVAGFKAGSKAAIRPGVKSGNSGRLLN